MTNSPQQIAEELARKCADNLTAEWLVGSASSFCDEVDWDSADEKDIINKILQSIPLVELLECISELKYQVAQHNRGHRSTSLELLNTKLKQLGIIE